MNKNNRVFVTFAICLQVFILLFATTAIPAAAEPPPLPSQLAYLFGDVVLDGKPAPVGVEITAKLNGNVVGTTVVEQAGVYGNIPKTMLVVNCDPEDYGDVKFYVNGLESQTVGENTLENGSPGNEIEIDLIAESPAVSNSGNGGSSGGSSGVSTGTSNEDTANPGGSGDDTGVNQQDTQPPEEISSTPDSEPAGSKNNLSTTIILAVVIVIVALGALFYAKNKGL